MAILVLLCGLTVVHNAQGRTVHWQKAGASVYGGKADRSSGCTGYRGFNLCAPGKWRSFAELGMGCNLVAGQGALGGLPNGTRIRVLYQHRKLTLIKRDCGRGGGPVFGFGRWYARAIDLWWRAGVRLRVHGLAVVQWRRLT